MLGTFQLQSTVQTVIRSNNHAVTVRHCSLLSYKGEGVADPRWGCVIPCEMGELPLKAET